MSPPAPAPQHPPEGPSSLIPPQSASSDSYSEFYRSSVSFCGRPGKNVVLDRQDGVNNFSSPALRPWSLHPHTYQPDPSLPFCNTPADLLASLALGTRLPAPAPMGLLNSSSGNSSSNSRTATYFAPRGCNFRWYTSAQACEIMGRYSSVTLIGDSLSRHHAAAMVMALTGDGVYGAIERQVDSPLFYKSCSCDGQFSEHKICRTHGVRMQKMVSPHAYGMCSTQHPEFQFRYKDKGSGDSLPDLAHLCSSDPRPRFVLLQGGAHKGSNPNRTIADIVVPMMELLNRTVGACKHRFELRVVWSGLNSQAPVLDGRYPHQSDARAVEFNSKVSRFVRAEYGVESLDFLNMTRNASVSDGYHYLSEVNLVKAMYTFNLLDLWAKPAVAEEGTG